MKNKKMLFFCHDIFDLYKIFKLGFEKYSGCEVTTIIYKDYKYKNNKERILNFLSKLFLGKNLKKKWQGLSYFENIDPNTTFDYAVTICPDVLDKRSLKHIKKISKKSVVYYWDGFDHFAKYKATIECFDECFSFDPKDAKNFNLNFLTNFYFVEDRILNPEFDIFFIGTYDNRYALLEKIINSIEDKFNLNIKVLQYSKNLNNITTSHPNSIRFISKPISMEEITTFTKNSKILLDIQKTIQSGLTFRVFEAMGLGKKLITTNSDIKNYDFYNPNNIFVWTDETKEIPYDFLNSPYEELPEEIYKKYSQKNWVETILGLNKTF